MKCTLHWHQTLILVHWRYGKEWHTCQRSIEYMKSDTRVLGYSFNKNNKRKISRPHIRCILDKLQDYMSVFFESMCSYQYKQNKSYTYSLCFNVRWISCTSCNPFKHVFYSLVYTEVAIAFPLHSPNKTFNPIVGYRRQVITRAMQWYFAMMMRMSENNWLHPNIPPLPCVLVSFPSLPPYR